jgi:putative nucleotidyltransferase with HDIG domain
MADLKTIPSKGDAGEWVLEVVRTLVALLEAKDPFLKKHSERVANNSANFCEAYKIVAANDVESIYFAGLLHDIGMVAVPTDILQNPETNDDEGMVRIKRHPICGEKILSNLSCLEDILPMVRHHHEAVDGSGYPDRIEGDNIPLGARVIGLFNYFDNIRFPRLEKKRSNLKDAVDAVTAKAGQLFDDRLIKNFAKFVATNSGQSEDYLLKKEAASVRNSFAAILKDFTSGKLNPPVMPQVVREIQTEIKRPNTTAETMTLVIEKDPVISLRLISIANSPVYRGVSEIKNVKSALPRLGLKETLAIVLAIANKDLYCTDKVQFRILMDKLWVHSLATAYGAKLIAQNIKLEDSDHFFLMGLTHDIGKILLLKAFTDISPPKNFNMNVITGNIQEAHISLGSLLLKRWGFDEEFINVLTHHDDQELSNDTETEILVIHLANMLTRKIGFSLFDGDFDLIELDAIRILKLDPKAIEEIGENIKQIISDVAHLF